MCQKMWNINISKLNYRKVHLNHNLLNNTNKNKTKHVTTYSESNYYSQRLAHLCCFRIYIHVNNNKYRLFHLHTESYKSHKSKSLLCILSLFAITVSSRINESRISIVCTAVLRTHKQ